MQINIRPFTKNVFRKHIEALENKNKNKQEEQLPQLQPKQEEQLPQLQPKQEEQLPQLQPKQEEQLPQLQPKHVDEEHPKEKAKPEKTKRSMISWICNIFMMIFVLVIAIVIAALFTPTPVEDDDVPLTAMEMTSSSTEVVSFPLLMLGTVKKYLMPSDTELQLVALPEGDSQVKNWLKRLL
jgi:hypothetical protein